jgi:uncharacterized membrane protein
VTVASILFLNEGFIYFGILHFFAFTSFLIYPILKYMDKEMTAFAGILFIILGIVLFFNVKTETSYFIWVGLVPEDFFTFDFFPIFPWFGVLLFGTFIGRLKYPNGERSFKIREIRNPVSTAFQFLGKNSLLIYFIHQPIILLILSLFFRAEIAAFLNL